MDRSQPTAHALVPEGGRVVIFRALPGLGDFLCVTPALRALRRHRPDVQVSYVGLPSTAFLVRRYPHLVDRFLAFPGYHGLPESEADPRRVAAFLRLCREIRFDLAIQLHGSGTVSNDVVRQLGAARVAGFLPAAVEEPSAAGVDDSVAPRSRTGGRAAALPPLFLPWIEAMPEIERCVALMAHLGWPSDDLRPEFSIAPGTLASGIEGAYVVVHAGASTAQRRWPVESFRDVAASIARRGLRIVLTGTTEDRERNGAIADGLPADTLDLAGRTTLDELAVVLRGSRLLVANDTGVAHLAAALDVPSVVVFTGSDESRWAPLDRERHAAVRGGVADVLREVDRRLAGSGVRHAA